MKMFVLAALLGLSACATHGSPRTVAGLTCHKMGHPWSEYWVTPDEQRSCP
jgi:hypothetical protein